MPHQPRFISHRIVVIAVLLFASHFANEANAAFLYGKTLSLSIAQPTIDIVHYDSGPFVVGDGPEVTILNRFGFADVILDVEDTQITFHYPTSDQFASGLFNGSILTDLSGSIGTFADFRLDSSTTLSGFDESRLFFDDHALYFNVTDLSVAAGNKVVASVPEASSAVLCSIGVIGLLAVGVRKRLIPRS